MAVGECASNKPGGAVGVSDGSVMASGECVSSTPGWALDAGAAAGASTSNGSSGQVGLSVGPKVVEPPVGSGTGPSVPPNGWSGQVGGRLG